MLDIYVTITDRIIATLKQGVIPWRKPWTGGNSGCISFSTGKPYSLLNHKKLIVSAAGAAEKAVSLILNQKEGNPNVRDPE